MPYTRNNSTIITTVNELDGFLPNETYETLSDALAEYAITLSETVSVTDGSWHTLSLAPTAKGACIIEPHSTNISAVFVCSKNSSSNNVSKVSSVSYGTVYLSCRWTNTNIEIAAINNTASFDITVNIR